MTKTAVLFRIVTTLVVGITIFVPLPVQGASKTGLAAVRQPGFAAAVAHGQTMPLAPPANDNFENATVISSVPFVVAGLNTAQATTQANDPVTPCGSSSVPQQSHSVWYRFTPQVTGNFNASTEGSNYDTVLAVWTGSWGALATQGCDDDGGPNGTSILDLTLQSGTTYYVEAMAWGDDPGGLLTLTFTGPPPNDDFDAALAITGLAYAHSESTVNASTADDDPSFICESFSGQGSNSVWYRVSSPYRRVLTASTLGPPSSDYDTVLGIFTGSRGALSLAACSDDVGTSVQSQAQVALQAGTTYYVEILSYFLATAGFLNFSASLGPICPDFVNPAGVGVEDVALIASKWGQQQGPPYDYNGDGLVTIYDIMQVTPRWGQNCLAITQPPEVTDRPPKRPAR